jgi:predicted transcriptional regulator
MKLTSQERNNLNQGARHPKGLIYPMRMSNFDKPERRMEKLAAAGLVTKAEERGFWKITDEGRKAVREANNALPIIAAP